MNITDYAWYRAWRRHEAYGVPVTPEGKQRADIRAEAFSEGFIAGQRYAATLLEREHSKAKKLHSFFLLASKIIRDGIQR